MELQRELIAQKQPKGKIVALSSSLKPSDVILNKLKEFKVNSIVKMKAHINLCNCNWRI